jgi:hypothetical protein
MTVSAEFAFGVPPEMPTHIKPADGTVTTANTFIIDWTNVTDGQAYRMELDDDSDFSSPERTVWWQYSTYPASDVPEGTYYWHTNARNSSLLWSGWTTPWTLTIVLQQFLPANNARLTVSTPYFDWEDAVAVVDYYQIDIATDDAFTNIVNSGQPTISEYTPPTLSDGVYYWRVAPHTAAPELLPYTPAKMFTIDTTPPPVPSPISPIGGALVDWANLKWTASATAISYFVEVATDAGFTNIVATATTGGTNKGFPGLVDGTYFWRVSATDSFGNTSAPSATADFVLDIP